MVKLTKQSLNSLRPRARPYIEYDTELIGFGVAVYPSGTRSWVCEYRPQGGGRGVAKKRVTIGKTSQMTPEQARKSAAEMLAAVRLGRDPAQEKAGASRLDYGRPAYRHVRRPICRADAKARNRGEPPYSTRRASQSTRCSESYSINPRAGHNPSYPDGRSTVRCQPRCRCLVKGICMGGRLGLDPRRAEPGERHQEVPRARARALFNKRRACTARRRVREGETIGLLYSIDETKPTAKHAPRVEHRRVKLDRFAAAAIRLLILTGLAFAKS